MIASYEPKVYFYRKYTSRSTGLTYSMSHFLVVFWRLCLLHHIFLLTFILILCKFLTYNFNNPINVFNTFLNKKELPESHFLQTYYVEEPNL